MSAITVDYYDLGNELLEEGYEFDKFISGLTHSMIKYCEKNPRSKEYILNSCKRVSQNLTDKQKLIMKAIAGEDVEL